MNNRQKTVKWLVLISAELLITSGNGHTKSQLLKKIDPVSVTLSSDGHNSSIEIYCFHWNK